MTRRTQADLVENAELLLRRALESLGLETRTGPAGRADLVLTIDGQAIPVQIRATSIATAEWVDRAVASVGPGGAGTSVVVADLVPGSAKDKLRAAGWGWLDRRGQLVLRAPGVIIDAVVETDLEQRPRTTGSPISGRASISWASALLMSPDEPPAIREVARRVGISHSAIVTASARLRDAALIRADGKPLVPELFWALADAWVVEPVALANAPTPGEASTYVDLGLNLDVQGPGWAVAGTVDAMAWGAPAVIGSAYPPDFYVPSSTIMRVATSRLGRAERFDERACTIAVAPSPWHRRRWLASTRFDRPGKPFDQWRFAHPLFAALDLAQDKSRGTEILEDWNPKEFTRV